MRRGQRVTRGDRHHDSHEWMYEGEYEVDGHYVWFYEPCNYAIRKDHGPMPGRDEHVESVVWQCGYMRVTHYKLVKGPVLLETGGELTYDAYPSQYEDVLAAGAQALSERAMAPWEPPVKRELPVVFEHMDKRYIAFYKHQQTRVMPP